MSDIEDLQRRIVAAMDRVANGLNTMAEAGADTTAALKAALEDERTVNAQLNERVRKLSEQQGAAVAEAKAVALRAQARTEELDVELQRLRKANVQLREAIGALRTANEEGVGDPDLINKSMMAELDALRAARSADAAEASTIISALSSLLEQSDETGEENAHA